MTQTLSPPRSFLFTDVEGSTKLWETDPDGMAASLEMHDRIMRRTVDRYGGYVFSTAGDAFAVAFDSIDEALSAATDVQLGLLEAAWPGPSLSVRMGVHTGTARERDGDFFGPVLNRSARIMSAGHGGQILVSSVTAEGYGDNLHDLGLHHLKDLDEPEHVYEVRHPDLPVVERPIRSLDVRRDNLPDYLTSFVGRAEQVAVLEDAVRDHRLVSLTGVGGTGKTRLAVETARRLAADAPDGAWLVELAPVTNPDLIMTTIANVWNLRAGEGATIEDVVVRYLWSRSLVIVMDNCEHVLEAAASTVRFLLDRCPDLRVIATTRESLGIPGEHNLGVPSLGVESEDDGPSAAARLFIDRAAAVRPDFSPSEVELADIDRICSRIDGIPLGLELAAARLRSMSPAELADRVERSFAILSGSAKTALPRQRTLHATIEWSYDLLEPEEQVFFRRLSVFAGGFDLDAAESVTPGGKVELHAVLDHLDSLTDKSLVVALDGGSHGTRYRLLEPVRQFAQEVMSRSDAAADVRLRHARHYAQVVAETSPAIRSPQIVAAKRRIKRDYDNVRAALDTLLESGHIDEFLQVAFDMFLYWMHEGLQIEGIELSEPGLRHPDGDPLARIKLAHTMATLAAEVTRPAGIEYGRIGLALAEELGDMNVIGRLELALGAVIRHSTTDPEYLGHLQRGRELVDQHPGTPWWDETWDKGINHVVLAAYMPHDDERLEEHIEKALTAMREHGDIGIYAALLSDAAGFFYFGGDKERGLAAAQEAAEIYADLESPSWHGHVIMTNAILLRGEGDMDRAGPLFLEAAELLESVGDVNCWARSTNAWATCVAGRGNVSEAAAAMGSVIDALPILPMQEIAGPQALDGSAWVLLESDEVEEGARLLGASLAAPFPIEAVIRPTELKTMGERARERLGDEVTEALIEEGGRLSVDDALVHARTVLAGVAQID